MSEDRPPADHATPEEESFDEDQQRQIEDNLKSKSTWLRLVFMIVFYVLGLVAAVVGIVVVVLGFLWVLFTGEVNEQLRRTGQGIATYLYQIVRYMTYNTDEKPFPFDAAWPSADED